MIDKADVEGEGQQQQQYGEGSSASTSQVDEPYAVPVPPPEAQRDDGGTGNGGSGLQEEPVTPQKVRDAIFHNGGYAMLVLVASFVLMWAASTTCSDRNFCKDKFGFAVAAGVISFIVAFVFIFLEHKENLTAQMRLGIVIFLFIWWVLVAGITTFGSDAPFVIPGNGYFAAWGGLLASLFMISNEVGRVRDTLDRFARLGQRFAILAVASLVVMFAGVAECDNGCTGKQGYAVAVGAISFCIVLVRILLKEKVGESAQKVFVLFMIVWWGAGLIVLTFFGPFEAVGNGYFGTWACLLASILLLNPAEPFHGHNESSNP